jgi:uncharacterized protein YyaL (SSP411 family)
MDADLKALAEASLALERAETAAGDGAFTGARDALDEAERGLQELRERWADMPVGVRSVVGPAAAEVRGRVEALARRLPRATALSVAAPEYDPEQDDDPAVG